MQFVEDHSDVFAVEYHTWWPGPQDPFYQNNIPENTDRTNYYNVNATPWEWVDGIIEPTWVYTYERIEAAYLTRKNTPTSVTLSHTGYYDAPSGALSVTAAASTDENLPAGDWRLQIVLTESEIAWSAPNGIETHMDIMRDMYPDAGGTPVVFTGGLPQTVEATATFDVSPYDAMHCDVVYFLQNYSTKEVFQAGSVPVTDLGDMTGVASAAPAFQLGNVFPNPFNPKTTIPVTLPRGMHVHLEIVDAQGRLQRVLEDGSLPAGNHAFTWDGRDESGSIVASGVYLVRFASENKLETRRLMLLK